MSNTWRTWGLTLCVGLITGLFLCVILPELLSARNITSYKDTISTSAPGKAANHTFSFILNTDVSPGGTIEIIPPPEFEILATTTFSAERNVELKVNGLSRSVGVVQSATDDFVEITPGIPGLIRYTLNTSDGINSGSTIEIRVGNHTSLALVPTLVFSSTTGTTTVPGDTWPIINSTTTGTHSVNMRVYSGGEVADAGFLISITEQVGVGPADTRETIPPLRFEGAPTGTLSGTTLGVELSLETDEFAVCRYSTVPGETYASMTGVFINTGLIFHTTVVTVTPNSLNTFYIRCIDDEGNFNTDDYEINFSVSAQPTGTANETGSTTGDGTGSGDDGTGSGGGGGGTTGQSDGVAPTEGGTSGGGGSGGGSGSGSGGGRGSEGGGGFESSDGPYRSGDGQVTINGYTAPRSQVTVLVDGTVAKTATAGSDGSYSIVLDLIARGVYTFGVYSTDAAKVKTSTFSTSFTVTGARASTLSNIILAPSILVTPNPVNPGSPLTLSGYAIPNAVITIENEKDGTTASRKQFTATATANGMWSLSVNTTGFLQGTYKTRAKALQTDGLSTNFSNYTLYGVGQAANRPLNTDLNRDGKVNLTDFSILLFWWNTAGGDSDPPADVNGDGRVNLTDFSILLFNWTG